MENASPLSEGKAFRDSAESAYDALAETHNIDINGDDIPGDDDEPVVEPESAVDDDAPVVDDEPVVADDPELPIAADTDPAEPVVEPLDEAVDLPPHTWRQEWKDQFNNIPKEGRAAMLELNQQMNQGFTRRMMELSELRRDMTGAKSAMEPHQERLARAGISPEVAIQRSLAWDAHIQRNPQQGILDMAKAYGVDLGQVTHTGDEQYLTPTERAQQQMLAQQGQSVQQIEQRMNQWQQMQQNQEFQHRQANAYNMLDEFMNATDDKGNQIHPYIEHCAPQMTHYIQTGAAGNLDEAYQMAVAMNPDIKTARDRQRQTDQVKAARRKADKVRKASSGIVDKSGKAPVKGKAFEDRLLDNYDKIANA